MTTPKGNARPDLGTVCMDQSLVTLKVGPDGDTFFIHKGVLCAQSPYFRAALTEGRWKESQDNSISLDETDPELFKQLVVEWLYTGKLRFDPESDGTLIDAYVFADRCDVPALRSAVVKQFYNSYVMIWHDSLPSYKQIIYMFENLPPKCKLCELFVDLYGWRWYMGMDDESEVKLQEQLPASFLLQVMERLGNRQLGGNGCKHELVHYSEQEKVAEAQVQAAEASP